MKNIVIGLLFVMLAGCASFPTEQEAAVADYGSYPDSYEQIVKSFYNRTLKDPSSVQYRRISTPKTTWLGNRFTGVRYGYLVCVTLNAKNSYGAYVGFDTDGFLIRNGSIIEYVNKGIWFERQIC